MIGLFQYLTDEILTVYITLNNIGYFFDNQTISLRNCNIVSFTTYELIYHQGS